MDVFYAIRFITHESFNPMTTPMALRRALLGSLLFSLLAGLLALSGTLQGWHHLQQLQREHAALWRHMDDANTLVVRNRAELAQTLQATAQAPNQPQEIQSNIDHISQHLAQAIANVRDPQESLLVSQVAQQRTQYLEEGLLPALDAMHAGAETAQQHTLALRALGLYQPFDQSLNTLMQYQHQRAEREHSQAHQDLQNALQRFAALALLLLVLSLLLRRLWAVYQSVDLEVVAVPVHREADLVADLEAAQRNP